MVRIIHDNAKYVIFVHIGVGSSKKYLSKVFECSLSYHFSILDFYEMGGDIVMCSHNDVENVSPRIPP